MNLSKRSYKKELLDNNDIPFSDIQQNMQELNVINSKLGGHNITIEGLKKIVGREKTVHVCEIGCGGGDNLSAILKWCKKHKVEFKFTGIDIKQECIDFAKTRTDLSPYTKWIVSDFSKVHFDTKADIIFSSLFCHHFTDEDLIQQLQWMHRNSRLGFFINDLQRHFLAYYSIKLITALFSKSYLVKNDAPLSVARGFTSHEWESIFKLSGIRNYNITWKWAFRYLIVYQHAAKQV